MGERPPAPSASAGAAWCAWTLIRFLLSCWVCTQRVPEARLGVSRTGTRVADAARELPVEDALQLVRLNAERGSPKYEKAALRWLERYLSQGSRRRVTVLPESATDLRPRAPASRKRGSFGAFPSRAGDVDAVELYYYQVLYVPFFNDRLVALSAQYRLTENRSKNRDTAQRIFADFGEHALPMKLGSIACPTVVIHCEHDPVPVASSAAIADAIPQGQLVVIPGSSHYGFLESPETVAAAVETFLVAHAS
ncbi:MAG TPA: alpha/beta hydrolase [Gaiellaceae bacterium]|nr:alpha/beta hydrolase [Gaiellaceae bacterium]